MKIVAGRKNCRERVRDGSQSAEEQRRAESRGDPGGKADHQRTQASEPLELSSPLYESDESPGERAELRSDYDRADDQDYRVLDPMPSAAIMVARTMKARKLNESSALSDV